MALVRNRPSALGRELGKHLARFCDQAEAEQRKRFPDHAERCKSCAFRAGTIPNGCESTAMDATKAWMEHVPFLCHEHKGDDKPVCAGWALMVNGETGPVKAPWPFSDEITGEGSPPRAGE